jgi:hypothetical protein
MCVCVCVCARARAAYERCSVSKVSLVIKIKRDVIATLNVGHLWY